MLKKIISIMSVLFTILFIPTSFAAPMIISEGNSMGYDFSVIKEQNDYTWEIGYKDTRTTIIENVENRGNLEKYRMAVIELDTNLFTIIIATVFLLIASVISFIFFKRNKNELKNPLIFIITLMIGIAIYNIFTNVLDLNRSTQDAQYYFNTLIN